MRMLAIAGAMACCWSSVQAMPAWLKGEWVGEAVLAARGTLDTTLTVDGVSLAELVKRSKLVVKDGSVEASSQFSLDLLSGSEGSSQVGTGSFNKLFFPIDLPLLVGKTVPLNLLPVITYVTVHFTHCTLRANHIAFEDGKARIEREGEACPVLKVMRFPGANRISVEEGNSWFIFVRRE